MRKPLQQTSEGVHALINSGARQQGHILVPYKWSNTEGLIFRNTGDVLFLIETANKFLNSDKLRMTDFNSQFGISLNSWITKFESKGFTRQMLSELRDELGNIRFFHFLNPAIPSRGKPLPHWDYIADTEDFRDPKILAAYAFSQQLTLDGFAGLKRCRLNSCKKFFIGRPNTKWCSDSCGSLSRVRQKRHRDRL